MSAGVSIKVKIGRRNLAGPASPATLPVALGIRHTEIAIHLLLGIASLLVTDDQHFLSVETRHAADDCGIVGKTAVAVDLAPVGEDALHVIQCVGALGMARHLGALPGIQVGRYFTA